MRIVTLTAKRQTTFPKEVCDSLGLQPGDKIELESREEGGNKVWLLRRRASPARSWVGCLGARANRVTDHSLAATRKSIAAGRKAGS